MYVVKYPVLPAGCCPMLVFSNHTFWQEIICLIMAYRTPFCCVKKYISLTWNELVSLTDSCSTMVRVVMWHRRLSTSATRWLWAVILPYSYINTNHPHSAPVLASVTVHMSEWTLVMYALSTCKVMSRSIWPLYFIKADILICHHLLYTTATVNAQFSSPIYITIFFH